MGVPLRSLLGCSGTHDPSIGLQPVWDEIMIKDLDGYNWWGETDTEGVISRPELLPSARGTTVMILASRTQGLGITRDAKRIIATCNPIAYSTARYYLHPKINCE